MKETFSILESEGQLKVHGGLTVGLWGLSWMKYLKSVLGYMQGTYMNLRKDEGALHT